VTHRLPRLIAPLAALALALTACTAGSSTASAPATGSGGSTGGASTEKITLGLIAEPANLDFTKTDGAAIPQALLVNVYEGLVKLDQDGKIVPALATSWKVSDDHKTYTFELAPSPTVRPSRPTTPCSRSTGSRPIGQPRSRRRWMLSPRPRRSAPPNCR